MKPRVLHIGKYYPPCKGGIETHLHDLCHAIQDEVSLCVLVANRTRRTIVENNNRIRIIRTGSLVTLNSLPICPRFPSIVKNEQCDIIHLHMPNPLAAFFTLRHLGTRKLILSWHSDIVRQKYLKKLFHWNTVRLLDTADSVIVPTSAHIEISLYLARYRKKCCIIPYGIDTGKFDSRHVDKNSRNEIIKRFDLPIVLFVGRLVGYKGLNILIDAIHDLDAALVIVGNGPVKNRLDRKISELNMQDRVWFAGEVKDQDLAAFYHACDIFCLPSTGMNEAFGIVQLEAMAAGKPVVASKLKTGVRTVTIDGETGFFFTPGKVNELKEKLLNLIKNPELAKQLGESGCRRVRTHYNGELTGKKTLELYRNIMNL